MKITKYKKTGNVHMNIAMKHDPVTIILVEKAISITYSECVSVAIVTQHAKCSHYVVMCGLTGSTVIFCIISQTARFLGKSY